MQIQPNTPSPYPYLPSLGGETGEVPPAPGDQRRDVPILTEGDSFERSVDGDAARSGESAIFGAARDLPGQGSVGDDGRTISLPGSLSVACPLCGEAHNVSFHSIGAQAPGEASVSEVASEIPEATIGPASAPSAEDEDDPRTASQVQAAGAPAQPPSGKAGVEGLEDKDAKRPSIGVELTEQEKERVDYLQKRDREVRSHEQAHVAAGGQYVRGGAQYQYESGPDGRRYAVGGEVSIDTSKVSGDAQATIRKAQAIRRAALAPADPSTQDYRAAASASRIEAEARRDLAEERASQASGTTNTYESKDAEETKEGRLSEGEAKRVEPDSDRKVPSLGSNDEDPKGVAPPEGGLAGSELEGVLDTAGLVDTGNLVLGPTTDGTAIDAPGPVPEEASEPPPPEPAVPSTARLDTSGTSRPGQLIDLYG